MPLNNLLDNEFEFMFQTKQSINSILDMPYWKFEEFIERLNNKNKQKEQEEKKQQQQQQQSQFKTPNYKQPRFKMPKY